MQKVHLIGPPASAFVDEVSLLVSSLPLKPSGPRTGQTLHLWQTQVVAAAAAAVAAAAAAAAAGKKKLK